VAVERRVVPEVLRAMDDDGMDTGGDVGRNDVKGSITSGRSRGAICTGKGGDMARTGDVYPEYGKV